MPAYNINLPTLKHLHIHYIDCSIKNHLFSTDFKNQ